MKKKNTIKKQIRFSRPPYRFWYIHKIIRWYFYEIKYGWQRMMYGYCDMDSWDIDHWFLNTVPNMLQLLREKQWGHPANMTSEEWNKILDEMIFYLREADEEQCSRQEPSFDWKSETERNAMTKDEEIQYNILRSNWFEESNKIAKYRDEMKDKGLEMFKEYFWNLWD